MLKDVIVSTIVCLMMVTCVKFGSKSNKSIRTKSRHHSDSDCVYRRDYDSEARFTIFQLLPIYSYGLDTNCISRQLLILSCVFMCLVLNY